jgi:hypothetical protein
MMGIYAEFMAQVPLPNPPGDELYELMYKPKAVLDWGWLKVHTRLHERYGMERHITIKLPVRRRVFFDAVYDTYVTARPAFFIAFGMVECAHTGWHARGQIISVDCEVLRMEAALAVDRAIRRGEKPKDPGPGPYPETPAPTRRSEESEDE